MQDFTCGCFQSLLCSGMLFSIVSACGSSSTLDAAAGGLIGSPNYPSNYNNNHRCNWYIQSDFGTTIRLEIQDFITESGYDYLTVGLV